MIDSVATAGGDRCPSFYPRGAYRHSAVKNRNPGMEAHEQPSPEPLIDAESAAFLFATMTWNVNLLEVLLAKAPNPLDCGAPNVPVGDSPPIGAGAAFPSLEEALVPAAGATHRGRPTRSKRRKLGRVRGTHLPLAYHADLSKSACGESVTVLDGVYLTEEEEVMDACQRTGCQPTDLAHQSHFYVNPNLSNGEKDAGETKKESDTNSGNNAGVREGLSVAEKNSKTSMRNFLRQFFQSFVLVMAAQVRHVTCTEPLRNGQSLTPLESRALRFVQRHMCALKDILSQYVMYNDSESHRRGAQPLLLDAFARESHELSNADWKPQHEQVYISGKEPVYQPLLLDTLGITRIVQCYAERSDTSIHGLALNALYCWQRLLLEPDCMQAEIFQSPAEWDTGRALFTQCLTSLNWEPYSTFGPYRTSTARLPLTGRRVVKLIIPAEDRAEYNLSVHFQEGVFRFIHGSALFPNESMPCAALVHCSAGRHRSSGTVAAYLLWLAAQSRGAVPNDRQRDSRTVAHPPQEPDSASYLRAVRRYPPLAESSISGSGNTNEGTTVLQRCVAHVQQQRQMAIPIETVQQQLAAYAAHLSLD